MNLNFVNTARRFLHFLLVGLVKIWLVFQTEKRPNMNVIIIIADIEQ